MNIGMIFLCLLVGAVVGFEFGKGMERLRFKAVLKGFDNAIKETAGKLQQFAEKQKEAESLQRSAIDEHQINKVKEIIEEATQDGKGA